ncbi:sulfate/molybdate ABC transporter ATP-binding protein [Atopobiaceae bacterium SGI.236]
MSLVVDIEKDLAGFSLDVSFCVDDAREVMGLLGASGCGKSMTLKCIAGVVTPDCGHIELDGRVLFDSESRVDVPARDRRVGYLFQDYALFPNMDVLHNVMAGVRSRDAAERRRVAMGQIRAFRLDGLERLRPAQLSGGQRQRVAIARIMGSDPDLLLLDEPFSALDGYLRWQLELELSDTLREFGRPTVFVSHSRDEVYRLCDTVCVVSSGTSEPKLTVPQLFSAPDTLSAALISGCKNVSRARPVGRGLLACDDWGVTLRASREVAPDATHVGIRAHYLRVVSVGEGLAGPSAAPGTVAGDGVAEAEVAAADAGGNLIGCVVDRVIDSTFSTIVMLATPGGARLRHELEKDEWAALESRGARPGGRLTIAVDPSAVMPLRDVTGVAPGDGTS